MLYCPRSEIKNRTNNDELLYKNFPNSRLIFCKLHNKLNSALFIDNALFLQEDWEADGKTGLTIMGSNRSKIFLS